MPIKHQAAGPSVWSFVASSPPSGELRDAYNECVQELEAFRAQHASFAFRYIRRFSEQEKGTGGSNFMPALTGYKTITAKHLLL